MGNASSTKLCPFFDLIFGAALVPPGSIMPPLVIGNQAAYKASSSDSRTNDKERQKTDAGLIFRVVFFTTLVVSVTILSGFFMDWLDEDEVEGFSAISVLKFGTIPIVAAVIGYATNVVALWMMFWPIEFVGCFPQLKLGPPLDFFLCGYQGVIPMKGQQMAEISYDMMTTKLIKVTEIFERLDPEMMHNELKDIMPQTISEVLDSAASESIPEVWAKMPDWLKRNLEDRTTAATGALLTNFIGDMKGNIDEVFDLKHCVVEFMVANKRLTNSLFFECGKEELDFIKVTGFYLGYIFGLVQMLIWVFARHWWILPICGVLVGYLTNEFALKAIFIPVNPRKICGGLYTVQGLFLKRQNEVSPIYAHKVATEILSTEQLIDEMCCGPRSEKLHELVDKHVMHCLQEQIGNYKQLLVWSIGPDDLDKFQAAACSQFWKRFRSILSHTSKYMDEAMQLEQTLTERMQAMPSSDFERLLHSVFEQDEFKLAVAGAFLGALVGLLQAIAQEPQQLGIHLG